MIVCDGLKGLPDSVAAVWPVMIVQACIVHLMRNAFKYASPKDSGCHLSGPEAGLPGCDRRGRRPVPRIQRGVGQKCPAIVRLWENARAESVPFLQFDREIRWIVCTLNAIHSVNARIRKPAQSPRPLPQRASRP